MHGLDAFVEIMHANVLVLAAAEASIAERATKTGIR